MSKVKDLEQQVTALSPRGGKLDAMAEKALRDHAAGKTKPL